VTGTCWDAEVGGVDDDGALSWMTVGCERGGATFVTPPSFTTGTCCSAV